MVDGIFRLAYGLAFYGDLLRLLRGRVIHKETPQHRSDPQVLLLVGGYGCYGRVVDDAVQITIIAAEFLLVVIVDEKPLVVGAQPDVLPGVLEYLCQVGIRNRQREACVALTAKGVCQQVQFEHAVLRGTQQDGVVLQQTGSLYSAAVSRQPLFNLLAQGYELSRLCVEDGCLALARHQQQSVLQQVEVGESCSFRVTILCEHTISVAVIHHQILRSYDQDIVGSIDEAVAKREIGHRTGDARQEDVVQFVVDQHLRTVIGHHATFGVHQQFAGIAVAGLHGDALKGVHVGVAGYAVHRGYP